MSEMDEMITRMNTALGKADYEAERAENLENEVESLRLQLANARKALEAASELLAPMGNHYRIVRVRDQVNEALKDMPK